MKRKLALGILAGLLAACAAIPSQDYANGDSRDGTNGTLRSMEYEYDNNWIDYGGHMPAIA